MELWRTPAASTFITFPMVDTAGLAVAGLTNIVGKWFAWSDTTGPQTGSVMTTLTGVINEVAGAAKSSIYSLTLAATELPTASPYTMCVFTSTSTPTGNAVATQYVLIRTASQFANVIAWLNNMVPATSVAGVPKVDVQDLLGTVVSTPATAGIFDVNVKNWTNQAAAATSVTGVPKVDLADILGTAVSAPATAGILDVNVKNYNNQAAVTDVNANLPKVDVEDWKNAAVNALVAGRVDANSAVVGDKTGYALTQTFPTNFSSLSIDTNGRVRAQYALQKNVAYSGFTFLMTDSTTNAPKSGIGNGNVTVTRSIDGGALGAGTLSTVTELSNGLYTVNFGAGDLNGGTIVLRATAANANDTFVSIVTFT